MTRSAAAALAALLALAACAYSATLANGFTWDDEYVLLQNGAVRDLANLPRFFTDATTSAAYGGLVVYRPLRTAALALAHHAWGLAPFGYHLAGLLLHLVNVVLVYSVSRRLVGEDRWALAVAGLFAVHPINSEAVAGVVGLGDLMSAGFLLGALRLHLGLADPGPPPAPRIAGVVALFVCSVLSKETGVVFPLLVAWHEIVLAPRRGPAATSRVAYVLGLVAVGGGLVALRTAVMGGFNAGSWEGVTFGRTMAMQADVLARYLRLVALPEGLSVRHAIPVPLSFLEPRTLLSVAIVLAAVAAAVSARRRAPLVAFGIGWFFIGLLPVMNVIPVPGAMMGERFCYVPAIGLFVAAAEALRRIVVARQWARPHGAVGAALVLCALGATTFVRCGDWRDNLSLFEAAVRVAPESNAVRVNLVREYEARGRHELARVHWDAGAANTRAYAERYLALATRAESDGDVREAEAWYRRVLRLVPSDPGALSGLSRVSGRAR